MYANYFKIILFMWQYGLVDTFTAMNLIYNAGSQYGAIVLTAMGDGNITQFPRILFEPIAGLGLSYRFVKAAQTTAERRMRVATLAALLSTSASTVVGSTPATNAGVGGAVASHIAHTLRQLAQRKALVLLLMLGSRSCTNPLSSLL